MHFIPSLALCLSLHAQRMPVQYMQQWGKCGAQYWACGPHTYNSPCTQFNWDIAALAAHPFLDAVAVIDAWMLCQLQWPQEPGCGTEATATLTRRKFPKQRCWCAVQPHQPSSSCLCGSLRDGRLQRVTGPSNIHSRSRLTRQRKPASDLLTNLTSTLLTDEPV